MDGGRPRAVWPFLLVLAGLFLFVATMPPQWQYIARERTAEQSLSKAWNDMSISPGSSAFDSEDGEAPLVRPFRIVSAAGEATPLDFGPWLPATASEKLAAQPDATRAPEIVLPGLSPEPNGPSFDGPLIAPWDPSRAESRPGATSTAEPRHSVARRSTIRPCPASDAKDLRREAFSSSASRKQSDKKPDSIWCPPESLYAQLTPLTEEKATAAWAEQSLRLVRRLGHSVDDGASLAPEIRTRLRTLVDQADPLASRLNDPALATRLRRAGYAVRRRLDIWECAVPPFDSVAARPEVDLQRVRLAVADVDAVIRDSAHVHRWREYLLLGALREASHDTEAADDAQQTALARRILGRVALTRLTKSQRSFLASEPLDRLAAQLRRMATRRPDRAYLLAALERYEQTGLADDAQRLADECLWLDARPGGRLDDLRRRMTMHYRNANLRIELSKDFLNRLMPKRLPEYAPVRDTVLGNPVRGKSLTATDVGIELIPDARRLRLSLQITGEVATLTSSRNGPARFQNTSESRYRVSKPMELSVDGLTLSPAEVEEVSNVTRLRKLRTTFDNIPLLGALIQNVARTQHEMKRADVRREIRRKVAARAKRRIDDEAGARLDSLSEKLRQRVLEPMQDLSLGPKMIEAKTTEDRLTMRLRIASPRQLGAHTPRPRTPPGSLASFQVHQTAMNNLVERLALDGETFTLPELRSRLARRLHWPELQRRSTDHDDVTITFADENAVRVAFQDGRITIHLAIARLQRARRTWRHFQVRADYRIRVDGLSAELVRDGVVKLPGRRVRTSSQIALRAIFSKIFSKNEARQIIPDRIRNHPKMKDLAVMEMVIEDGWVAVALGSKPQLAQVAATKRPK